MFIHSVSPHSFSESCLGVRTRQQLEPSLAVVQQDGLLGVSGLWVLGYQWQTVAQGEKTHLSYLLIQILAPCIWGGDLLKGASLSWDMGMVSAYLEGIWRR